MSVPRPAHPASPGRSRSRRRHVTMQVCIVTSKRHVRRFLAQAFGEIGFVVRECEDIAAVIASHYVMPTDLVVIAESRDDREGATTLHRLAAEGFGGSVMLVGDCWSPPVPAAQHLGKQLGLTMLQVLGTPFSAEDLAGRVAALRPAPPPAPPTAPAEPVEVCEALGHDLIDSWDRSQVRQRSKSAVA